MGGLSKSGAVFPSGGKHISTSLFMHTCTCTIYWTWIQSYRSVKHECPFRRAQHMVYMEETPASGSSHHDCDTCTWLTVTGANRLHNKRAELSGWRSCDCRVRERKCFKVRRETESRFRSNSITSSPPCPTPLFSPPSSWFHPRKATLTLISPDPSALAKNQISNSHTLKNLRQHDRKYKFTCCYHCYYNQTLVHFLGDSSLSCLHL